VLRLLWLLLLLRRLLFRRLLLQWQLRLQ